MARDSANGHHSAAYHQHACNNRPQRRGRLARTCAASSVRMRSYSGADCFASAWHGVLSRSWAVREHHAPFRSTAPGSRGLPAEIAGDIFGSEKLAIQVELLEEHTRKQKEAAASSKSSAAQAASKDRATKTPGWALTIKPKWCNKILNRYLTAEQREASPA